MLAATLEALRETGYAALTVDGVARRAGVDKTTIYRRWQTRERVVVDALTSLVAVDVPIPDTGAIDSDLRELARALVRWLTSPAGAAILAATLSDAARIPEITEVQRRFFADRFRRAAPVVERAIARGELPPGTDPAALVKAMIAPVYLRLLVTAEPVDAATADHAVATALAAARAGLLERWTSSPPAG